MLYSHYQFDTTQQHQQKTLERHTLVPRYEVSERSIKIISQRRRQVAPGFVCVSGQEAMEVESDTTLLLLLVNTTYMTMAIVISSYAVTCMGRGELRRVHVNGQDKAT
jgi:hypothetical protein